MNPIAAALLAVMAARAGDVGAAQEHLISARQHARSKARRDRQVVEIASLVVAGHRGRAEGLSLEHTAEFPEDAALLAHVAGAGR